MASSRFAVVLPYLAAFAMFVGALLLRTIADPFLENRPFAVFLIAAILAARYCGFAPSILALALGSLASRYFFITPRGSFAIADPVERTNFWFFIVIGLFFSLLLESERKARAEARQQTQAALQRQRELELEIAERKRAEEQLETRESQLSGILDHTTAVVYLKDKAGRYLLRNRRFQNLLERDGKSILGKTDLDHFPHSIASTFQESDAKVWSEQQPLEFEEVAPHADGLHTYRSVKFPVRDEAGNMIALGGISTDVSDLKAALEGLVAKQELLRNLIDVQEQERQFLCHEFHDGLIQYAVGSLMLLEGHQGKQPSADDSATLARVIGSLRKGVEDGRRVIRGIQPPALDDSGLAGALEDLIGQFSTSEMMVTSKCDAEIGRLPKDMQRTIYRVVQEALNNARKHSGTDVVRIEIQKEKGDLLLEIRDFGCGFDVSLARKRGFGMLGMKERVRLLGGECEVHSEPEEGTRIFVRLPLPKAGDEPC